MGILGKLCGEEEPAEKYDEIVSAVLIEQTQLYKNKTFWGRIYSGSVFGDPIAMSQSVPDGAELSFSVTYKTGRRKILKVMSGTALADRLLQLAMDPDIKRREVKQAVGKASQKVPHTSEKALIQLRKNQLPQGRYIFGKDLPVGTFDFTWVWGSGSVGLYGTAENTTLGNCLYSENVGNRYDYEYRQCLHVQCESGNMLTIGGNLVVEISRSPKLEIDL